MALPGYGWLRGRLAGTETVSGGWEAKMHHPVMGGAGFAMSVMWVLIWLVTLIPLCLWAGVRRLRANLAQRPA